LTEYGPTQEMLTAGRLSALFQYPLHALECDGRVSFIPA
jgi:iron complex transport system ATP-binding protein